MSYAPAWRTLSRGRRIMSEANVTPLPTRRESRERGMDRPMEETIRTGKKFLNVILERTVSHQGIHPSERSKAAEVVVARVQGGAVLDCQGGQMGVGHQVGAHLAIDQKSGEDVPMARRGLQPWSRDRAPNAAAARLAFTSPLPDTRSSL